MKRETDRKVLGVFRMLLGLPEPWRMLAVEIKGEVVLQLAHRYEFPSHRLAQCPVCAEPTFQPGNMVAIDGFSIDGDHTDLISQSSEAGAIVNLRDLHQ